MESKIKNIDFQYASQPSKRRIKVTMTSGHKVYIVRCYESWQQYGGTESELWQTMPIAEKFNNWLHGRD